jgi:hypothetical protein
MSHWGTPGGNKDEEVFLNITRNRVGPYDFSGYAGWPVNDF